MNKLWCQAQFSFAFHAAFNDTIEKYFDYLFVRKRSFYCRFNNNKIYLCFNEFHFYNAFVELGLIMTNKKIKYIAFILNHSMPSTVWETLCRALILLWTKKKDETNYFRVHHFVHNMISTVFSCSATWLSIFSPSYSCYFT